MISNKNYDNEFYHFFIGFQQKILKNELKDEKKVLCILCCFLLVSSVFSNKFEVWMKIDDGKKIKLIVNIFLGV